MPARSGSRRASFVPALRSATGCGFSPPSPDGWTWASGWIIFGIVRIGLGGWILLLPTVEKSGFRTLSIVLAVLLLVSGLIGIVFAPSTRGRDLSETEGADVAASRWNRRSLQTSP